MIDLKSLSTQYYHEVTSSVLDWCNELYATQFEKYFEVPMDLYHRLNSDSNPITDSELESILIDVPLDLIQASEYLTTVKTSMETIKLAMKKKKADLIDSMTEGTASAKNAKADIDTIEDQLLLLAYQSLISRVESKISFTRELIMGAKKIFDRRKANEEVMPVKPIDERPEPEALPNYSIPGSTYVG